MIYAYLNIQNKNNKKKIKIEKIWYNFSVRKSLMLDIYMLIFYLARFLC